MFPINKIEGLDIDNWEDLYLVESFLSQRHTFENRPVIYYNENIDFIDANVKRVMGGDGVSKFEAGFANQTLSNLDDIKVIILTIEKNPKKLLSMVKDISPWGIQLLQPTKENVKSLSRNCDVRIIPVVHITNKNDIKKIKLFKEADYILLDSKLGHHLGGTGKIHDWNISKEIVAKSKIPIFLAGGLNEHNVKNAIKFVKPYAVDAESALRNKKGFRDLNKVKSFIKVVKS